DPGAILVFKRNVQPALLEGCATSACHGGDKAGDFRLHNEPRGDMATYTNFHNLVTYRTVVRDPNTTAFGGDNGVSRGLIERVDASQSLLLSYMLPRDIAPFEHPDVEGFKSLVSSPNDSLYRGIGDWMQNTLVDLRGDPYDFQLGFPLGDEPATQPDGEQADDADAQ
ncbi:MAG: hypothetical protein AAGK78_04820, partial [Planctomycetota bacterium]